MLKSKSEKIYTGIVSISNNDTIRINAGSFIINNTWISFSGSTFNIREYISSVMVGNRVRFFKDRNYAVYLLICLDPIEGITVVEGTNVNFTTIQAVPVPEVFNALPLIGLVLIQDGTRDIIYGYKLIRNENIFHFSGMGNILDRNLKGAVGDSSYIYGNTGLQGSTGMEGYMGITGRIGVTGSVGPNIDAMAGVTGLIGMTGINWDINVPFDILV
jgi:hypothetical protein